MWVRALVIALLIWIALGLMISIIINSKQSNENYTNNFFEESGQILKESKQSEALR